jgi:hypothetical protein
MAASLYDDPHSSQRVTSRRMCSLARLSRCKPQEDDEGERACRVRTACGPCSFRERVDGRRPGPSDRHEKLVISLTIITFALILEPGPSFAPASACTVAPNTREKRVVQNGDRVRMARPVRHAERCSMCRWRRLAITMERCGIGRRPTQVRVQKAEVFHWRGASEFQAECRALVGSKARASAATIADARRATQGLNSGSHANPIENIAQRCSEASP